MAQSYDVYFARMILTLGLVEREAIQGALAAYQQIGQGSGFPRFLVEHQLMDRTKVAHVARELERWFLFERRRAMGLEDAEEPQREATEEGKPSLPRDAEPDDSDESLSIPPDEESATPVVMVPETPASSSRPPIVVPAGKTPTPPASAPRPSVRMPTGTTPPAQPRPSGIGSVTPPASKPRPTVGPPPAEPPKEPAKEVKKKTSASHPVVQPDPPPQGGGGSQRTKKASTSGRVKKSARLKQPDAKSSKQWALFDKAKKDPLQRLVGTRLGRTEIVKLLMTGEVLTSFEGRHGDDERGALVKVLRPDKVKDKVALERFTREAQALAKIDHPNIARVLEAGTAEGVRYISMEVGSGEPLSVLLERAGRLTPDRVARIGRGVALGLAAAHRAGIIHRDLRPANILVEEGGTVKLVGFGVARDVAVPGRLTATGHITGHPSYVAPEIAARAETTPRADVYSLGIVLFLALAGRLPFESRSVVKLVGLHLNAPPPKLSELARGCPSKLAAMVEKLLAKDPEERMDAMDVANALAAKDVLEGYDANQWSQEKKPDSEQELRRAMATDEHPTVDESAELKLGGPACAACELPVGAMSTSLHGNKICKKCVERVEALELCAACLLEVGEKDASAPDVAVFSGHIYCRSCTRRVRLPCPVCKKEAPLSGLQSGLVKAKGDNLVHVSCRA